MEKTVYKNILFKKIDDCPNYYISGCGKVLSLNYWNKKYPAIIKFSKNQKGYYLTNIKDKNGKRQSFAVHRLVAKYYIPNIKSKPCVNHIDGNKLNNNLCNLEWVTYKENMRHAYDILKRNSPSKGIKGPHHWNSKKVVQLDKKTNKIIKIWDSITQAKEGLNLSSISHISEVCKGVRKTCGNYKWKFYR